MLKSVALGTLTTIISLLIFGYAISTFLTQEAIPLGEPGWREQHDQLTSLYGVKILTIIGWVLSAFAGGAVASLSNTNKGVRPAVYLAVFFLVAWALPTTIIAGSTITWVHISSVLVVLPFMCFGAWSVSRVRT